MRARNTHRPHAWARRGARLWALSSFAVALCACGGSGPEPIADPAEAFPGGETTTFFLFAGREFAQPAANLEDRAPFFTGDSLFNQAWVTAPASTTARDGLGPTFNTRSCAGCHFRDGRGRPPLEEGGTLESMLIRISIPGQGPNGEIIPDPSYGGQIQTGSLQGVPTEAVVRVFWEEESGEYGDGTPFSLRRPRYEYESLSFGPLPTDLLESGRTAPIMIGLGLLDAIPEQVLASWEDPDDEDGDGISGRINRVWDVTAGELRPGRFGWKAEEPTVRQQSAGALVGDMGITSPIFPDQNCPAPQVACAEAPNGGEPEIPQANFDRLVFYSSTLAPPTREDYDDPEVLRGREWMRDLGCTSCHRETVQTGEHPEIPELSFQDIRPFTDLLLHDMGEGLSDDRPAFGASGREWRTAPLWGIGRVELVNDHTFFLHDGRARGFAEAILWHGGEAEESKEAFRNLPEINRAELIRFLESL
ncbi:MAG: di-heme oxidoredictase family protein [Myxococcota bacterium]